MNYRFEGDGADIVSDAESHCTSCSGSNDDDTWTDDDENDANNEKSSISRFKVSNTVQATHLLSDESINVLEGRLLVLLTLHFCTTRAGFI